MPGNSAKHIACLKAGYVDKAFRLLHSKGISGVRIQLLYKDKKRQKKDQVSR